MDVLSLPTLMLRNMENDVLSRRRIWLSSHVLFAPSVCICQAGTEAASQNWSPNRLPLLTCLFWSTCQERWTFRLVRSSSALFLKWTIVMHHVYRATHYLMCDKPLCNNNSNLFVWPSGLRRCVKAAVLIGGGSNPPANTFLQIFFLSLCFDSAILMFLRCEDQA